MLIFTYFALVTILYFMRRKFQSWYSIYFLGLKFDVPLMYIRKRYLYNLLNIGLLILSLIPAFFIKYEYWYLKYLLPLLSYYYGGVNGIIKGFKHFKLYHYNRILEIEKNENMDIERKKSDISYHQYELRKSYKELLSELKVNTDNEQRTF